jgi:hypothetical protein
MIAARTAINSYTGRFSVTTGIPFTAINGAQAFTSTTDVGSGTLTFQSGESARFDYNVFGFTGSKQIQRQVFASPVTFCEPL